MAGESHHWPALDHMRPDHHYLEYTSRVGKPHPWIWVVREHKSRLNTTSILCINTTTIYRQHIKLEEIERGIRVVCIGSWRGKETQQLGRGTWS